MARPAISFVRPYYTRELYTTSIWWATRATENLLALQMLSARLVQLFVRGSGTHVAWSEELKLDSKLRGGGQKSVRGAYGSRLVIGAYAATCWIGGHGIHARYAIAIATVEELLQSTNEIQLRVGAMKEASGEPDCKTPISTSPGRA
ncbi:hypothetical protein ACLOJK_038893 [Asimina triloba]